MQNKIFKGLLIGIAFGFFAGWHIHKYHKKASEIK